MEVQQVIGRVVETTSNHSLVLRIGLIELEFLGIESDLVIEFNEILKGDLCFVLCNVPCES